MTTSTPPKTPGPQNPSKYPFTGPMYAKYGEQPGYIYVPAYDRYYVDPKGLQDYYKQQGLIEEPAKPPGLAATLAPVAATAGALYGAQAIAPQIIGSTKEGTGLLGLGKDMFGFGGPTTATQGSNAASAAASAGTGSAATGGLGEGGMSLVGGGEGVGGVGAAEAPGSGGLLSLGALAPAAVAAIGAYTAKKGYDAYKAGSGKGLIGGLKAGAKSAGALNFVPVLGQAAWLGGALGGLVGHKSTKDVQAEEASGLGDQSNDPKWQQAVSVIKDSIANGPADPSKPFGNTKGQTFSTFDEYKQAGLDPENMRLQPGVLKAFGSDYVNLSPDVQRQVTQQLINANLIDNEKGRVVVTDEDQARAIKDQTLAQLQPQATQLHGTNATTVGAVPIKRGGGLVSVGRS